MKSKSKLFCVNGQLSFQMRLDAQLHAEEEPDLFRIFFFAPNKVIEIGIRIQFKNAFVLRIGIDIIQIHVLRKAHSVKAKGNPF